MALRKPCNVAAIVVFYLRPPGSPATLCCLRRSPGLVSASNGSAVSPCCFSCARPLRSRPLAPSPTAAESFSPPAMAWPWPQPPQLAPEPTVVLTATPGGRSALPFPLLCTVAPFPPTPEVRQPLSSTPARITAALASPVCPVRCARAWAFRRCPPPAIWSPEQETRRPPPPRPRRRLNAGGIESFDQGFDLPWVTDRWARPLLTFG